MNDALRELPFWENLSEEEKTLCEMTAIVNSYPEGTYLQEGRGNNKCTGMIHVLSGEIRTFILSEEGREITLFRLNPGDNCVLSASCVLSQVTFVTQQYVTKDAKIMMIPSSVFEKLINNNIYVRCFSFELATERFSTVMWVMQQILFHGFDKRLSHFLLSEYSKTGSREIRMTQEEIAVSTNSAREVVARMLKQFSAYGMLEYGRGVIILKDVDALRNV